MDFRIPLEFHGIGIPKILTGGLESEWNSEFRLEVHGVWGVPKFGFMTRNSQKIDHSNTF